MTCKKDKENSKAVKEMSKKYGAMFLPPKGWTGKPKK